MDSSAAAAIVIISVFLVCGTGCAWFQGAFDSKEKVPKAPLEAVV